MRKPQTVAAILVTVALLTIAAACGSDRAGPDSAGLSPLAPDQIDPSTPKGESGARRPLQPAGLFGRA